MNENLKQKLADEHIKFLRSPIWAIIKYRLEEYIKRQEQYSMSFTRNGNNHGAISTIGMADGAIQAIKLTEGLNREIMEETFDVDAALHVIENKAGK